MYIVFCACWFEGAIYTNAILVYTISFPIRKILVQKPQTETEMELFKLQEEKQTDEDREYETSDSSPSLSNGEESDEDRVCSRKSSLKVHVLCKKT